MFSGSRLKIERAKQHVNDLHTRSLAFAKDCYALSVNTDSATGYDFIELEIVKSLPDDFALVLGDALHNLKSALDLTLNEVIFSRLGLYDDYSRFPVRDTGQELASAVKGGRISKSSKAVSDFIMDVVKPYKGGNDAIWTLHRLNILDKHRLILPVWQVNAIHDISAENDRGEQIRISPWAITRGRTSRFDCQMKNVKITNYGKATLLILFEKGLPVGNEAVLPTLHELTKAVGGVVDGIETAFLSEKDTHS